MKFLILAVIVFFVYRWINPPNQITQGKDDSNEFTDYEELD